jgi:hypothetical protein
VSDKKIRHQVVAVHEQAKRLVGMTTTHCDLNKYLRAKIHMDEVNARILRAVEAKDMPELLPIS